MKKHRITIVILIVLASIAAVFVYTQNEGTFRRDHTDFAIADTSNVVKIFLADKSDNRVILERQENGKWLVNDEYLVRRDMIDLLLATMKNLSVAAPVPRAAYNTAVTNLATQSTKVEVYQKKHLVDLFYRFRIFPRVLKTKVYYVGNVTPDNIGTHMIMENSDMPFVVYWPGFRGFVASRFSTNEKDWRDHGIFRKKYMQIQSVDVFFPDKPEQSYRAINTSEGLMDLVPHGQSDAVTSYDTLKMLGFITAFEDLRYEALIDDMDLQMIDSITSSKPQHIITLTDIDGNITQVKTFRRKATIYIEDLYGQAFDYDPDRMYALVNNDEDFVLVQYQTFSRIIRPLQFFLNGKREQIYNE